ncbi:MAG: hypothetical protein JNJ85_04070 [Candidatus Kapabacteria bacterium]|nr:hypothetical protein [Candidatus Kapabacteria bacterium]
MFAKANQMDYKTYNPNPGPPEEHNNWRYQFTQYVNGCGVTGNLNVPCPDCGKKETRWWVYSPTGSLMAVYESNTCTSNFIHSDFTSSAWEPAIIKVEEWAIKGEGTAQPEQYKEPVVRDVITPATDPMHGVVDYREVHKKAYPITDYQGSTRAVVDDVRLPIQGTNGYEAHILGYYNYYPFGMPQPMRSMDAETPPNLDTTFFAGYQGMEKDRWWGSSGNHYNTMFRQYDPRIARWLTIDPIDHSWQSPYSSFGDNPILFVDPDGLSQHDPNKYTNSADAKYGDKMVFEGSHFWYNGKSWVYGDGNTVEVNANKEARTMDLTENVVDPGSPVVRWKEGATFMSGGTPVFVPYGANENSVGFWHNGNNWEPLHFETAQSKQALKEQQFKAVNDFNNKAVPIVLAAPVVLAGGAQAVVALKATITLNGAIQGLGPIAAYWARNIYMNPNTSAVVKDIGLGMGGVPNPEFAVPGNISLGAVDDAFIKNAQNIKPIEGFFDVVAHGSPTSVELNVGEEISHRILANLIRTHPDYVGQDIRLLSCNTGQYSNGFAQNLSNKLGVKVIAPNDLIWAAPSGAFVIGPKPYIPSGTFNLFKPGN